MGEQARSGHGAFALAEMQEFASFAKGTQRYIRRSLDIGFRRNDAIRLWARDADETNAIRAQQKAYDRIETIRSAIPDDPAIEEGEELIGDAENIESYSNVLSGVVKLTKTLSDGRQQIVGLQFAPDFLGRPFKTESAVSAEAATRVELCSFPRGVMERMMADQPDLKHRLLQQTLKELDEARDWMVTLGRKTAAEKVASFLLMIARNIDPAEAGQRGTTFDLPLSRAEIAACTPSA